MVGNLPIGVESFKLIIECVLFGKYIVVGGKEKCEVGVPMP